MRVRDTSAARYILLSVGRSHRNEDELQLLTQAAAAIYIQLLMQAAATIYILLQSQPWMLDESISRLRTHRLKLRETNKTLH